MESLPDHLLLQCFGWLSRTDHGPLRCVCRRFSHLLSVETLFDHRTREGCLEPWLCVLGGVQEDSGELLAEMFDFSTQKWRPMPTPPPNSFFNFSCAVLRDKLYVVGGFVGLADVSSKMCVYNMRTNVWEKVARMTELREGCACGVIQGRIYVAGGLCKLKSHQQRLNTAEVYLPEENRWLAIASMREGRSCCASAVVGDKLYVIGGYGVQGFLQTVEVYDPTDGVWSSRTDMPETWIIAGCAAIGSHIYVVGFNIIEMDRQELAVYDTLKDQWQLKGTIPFRRLVSGTKCNLWGCAVTSVQGKLYVLGGASSYDGGGLNTVLKYDPLDSSWMSLRQMRSRRHGGAAAVIHL